MFKLVSSIFLLGISVLSNAQGGWNIGYIKADSITKKHVGQIVRIDFKTFPNIFSADGLRHLRSYIQTKDTGKVIIDKTLLLLAERREVYVDHGSYNDQFLECVNCNDFTVFIYDAKILEVDPKSMQFQVDIITRLIGDTNQSETKVLQLREVNWMELCTNCDSAKTVM